MTEENKEQVIIYDNRCPLCRKAVKFLGPSESTSLFRFVPASAPAGDDLLLKYNLPPETTEKTVIFIQNGRIYKKSKAIIKALQQKGGIWILAGTLLIVPPFIRDFFYDLVAKNRKKDATN